MELNNILKVVHYARYLSYLVLISNIVIASVVQRVLTSGMMAAVLLSKFADRHQRPRWYPTECNKRKRRETAEQVRDGRRGWAGKGAWGSVGTSANAFSRDWSRDVIDPFSSHLAQHQVVACLFTPRGSGAVRYGPSPGNVSNVTSRKDGPAVLGCPAAPVAEPVHA
jgi:hypothetical protein